MCHRLSPPGGPRAVVGQFDDFVGALHAIFAPDVGLGATVSPVPQGNVGTSYFMKK